MIFFYLQKLFFQQPGEKFCISESAADRFVTSDEKKTLQILQRSLGGKEGIRTPEALLTLTRFPGGPLQPLEHLSE